MSVKDELAQVLADNLNKQFKDTKVAYFLDGSNATPTDVKEFISTGSSVLDLAISNRPNGGVAVGRITEINGLEDFLARFKGKRSSSISSFEFERDDIQREQVVKEVLEIYGSEKTPDYSSESQENDLDTTITTDSNSNDFPEYDIVQSL